MTLVLASLGKAKKLVMVYAGVQENQHQELVIRRAVEKLAEGFEVEPVLQQQKGEQGARSWTWEGAGGAALHWTDYSRDELSLRKLRLE